MSTDAAAKPYRTLDDILPNEHNNFGLLRLLAALTVVVSHSFYLAGAPESSEPLVASTGFSIGQHAVHVFFTISGVLIAASLVRTGSLLAYLQARALRLLPGLAACVLFTVFVLGPLLTNLPLAAYFANTGTWSYLAKTLGLVTAHAPLPGVFTDNHVPDVVNSPLWTLKYEAMCYLGLALLGITGLIRSRVLTTAVLSALLGAWVAVAALPETLVVGSTLLSFLRLAFSFGLGTLAYVWRDRLPLNWYGLVIAFFIAAAALGTPLSAPGLQLFAAYATLYIAGLPLGHLAAFSRKNDLSYGVYIYDWLIAQALVATIPGLSQPMLLAATVAIVLPLAALSWFLIEKPMLGLKRSRPASLAPVEDEPKEDPETANLPLPYPDAGVARDRLVRLARAAIPETPKQEVPAGL